MHVTFYFVFIRIHKHKIKQSTFNKERGFRLKLETQMIVVVYSYKTQNKYDIYDKIIDRGV